MPPSQVETAPLGDATSAATPEKACRKPRMRRVRKNDPNTFTFKLLQVPQQLQQIGDSQERRSTLQRVVRPNSKQKPQQPLPDFLLDSSSPLDFGICPNLPEDEKVRRCEEIYGQDRAAEAVKQTSKDGDCYFPQDGYDYNQHLATIGGGTFIANTAAAPAGRASPEPPPEDSEERRMLEAMDAPDLYEELADDFVADATVDEEGRPVAVDDRDLLWGSRPPLLPEIVSQRLQARALAEDEEHDATLQFMDDESQCSDSSLDGDNLASSEQQGPEAVIKSSEKDLNSLSNVRAQKLAQLLEEYCDAGIGELEPEEPEESDAFSELDEIFDDYLKSRENYGKVGLPKAVSASEKNERCNRRELRSAGSRNARRSSESNFSSLIESEGSDCSDLSEEGVDLSVLEVDRELTSRIHALILKQDEEGSQTEEKCTDDQHSTRARVAWDGETIISAKTAFSVAPRTIRVATSRASKSVAAPLSLAGLVENWAQSRQSKGVGKEEKNSCFTAEADDAPVFDIPSVSTFRPRGEAPEDRRARKAAVKEARRLVRQNKKANKMMQKEETKKAKASQARASPFDVRPGVSCFKL